MLCFSVGQLPLGAIVILGDVFGHGDLGKQISGFPQLHQLVQAFHGDRGADDAVQIVVVVVEILCGGGVLIVFIDKNIVVLLDLCGWFIFVSIYYTKKCRLSIPFSSFAKKS